ncbi:magnesium transporter MgtC [Candidatus Woesearchaeota archaeon]|nr:magnesium transporter MgtC [Candidatus Woesearchaeota archaeon]|tara:strand:+ start:811 stop:1212 length:402 start_codon:yes stop_codon:yes gene_type:complete
MIVDVEIFLRLLVASLLGGIIGLERKSFHKAAGIRTHMLIAMGAALFTILGTTSFSDPSRIVAGLVTGIGFLGAGAIFRSESHVKGLTTAASMWAVAAIGLSIGIGEYLLGAAAAVIVILILQLYRINFLREL